MKKCIPCGRKFKNGTGLAAHIRSAAHNGTLAMLDSQEEAHVEALCPALLSIAYLRGFTDRWEALESERLNLAARVEAIDAELIALAHNARAGIDVEAEYATED